MILTEIISGRMEKYNFATNTWETFLTLDNSNVVSANSQRQCTNDDCFNIGGVFSATLNLVVKIPPPYTTFNVRGCKVYLHSSLAGDIGVFFVTNVVGRVGRIFTLACHDAIIWTDTSSFTDSENEVVKRVINYFDDSYAVYAQGWMNENNLTGVVNRLCALTTGIQNMVWWWNYDRNGNILPDGTYLDVCNHDIYFGIFAPEGEGETDCPRDFYRYLAEISFGFVYTNPANGYLTLGQFAEPKWGAAEIQANEIEYGSEEYADYNIYMRDVKTVAQGDDGSSEWYHYSITPVDYSTAGMFDIVVEDNPFINGSYRNEIEKGRSGTDFLNRITQNFYYAFHRPAEIVQQGFGYLVSPFKCTVHGAHTFHLGQKVLIHHRVHDTTNIYTHDSIITKICWSLNGGQTIMCCGGDSRAMTQLYRGLGGVSLSKADKVRKDVQNHCYAIERKLSKLSGGATGYLNYVGDISLSTSTIEVVTDATLVNGQLQLTKKTIEYVSGWSWYRNAAYFQNGLLMSEAESWGTGSASDHTGTSTETYGTGGTHVYPPEPEPEKGKLSGVPPLAFYTTGTSLTNYTISGASGGVGDLVSGTSKYRITVAMLNKNLWGYRVTADEYGYLDDTGAITHQSPENYVSCGFIPIPSGISQLTFSFMPSGYPYARIITVCAYDANKNFISAPISEGSVVPYGTRCSRTFTVPAGTAFLRTTTVTREKNASMVSSDYEMQLEVGDTMTTYALSVAQKYYITLDAPLYGGETYTFDGTVAIGTNANSWNFLFVETEHQPENVTIWFDVEE